jgi:hypothetical protein
MSVDVRVGSRYAEDKPSLQAGALSDPREKASATLSRRNRRYFPGGGRAT